MLKPLKIAFVRLTAMGDIIHSASILPLLHQTLSQHYQPIFHWYIDLEFQEILQDSPYIDKLITLPLKKSLKNKNFKALYAIYQTLRLESYDIVIDLQGLLKSAIIGKFLVSKQYIGFSFKSTKESFASLFYNKTIQIPYQEHILLRNATLAFSAFNLPIPNIQTLLNPKPFLGFNPNLAPSLNQDSAKILLVLETSKPNKTYPQHLFLELTKLFNTANLSPILLSHKSTITNSTLNFQALSNLSLNTIKALVAQMDLVIGGDTGITHLAWALKRPSITLFGATPPSRFNLQTKQNYYLMANPNANYNKQDFSIQKISPKEIFDLAITLLKGKI